MQSLNYHAACCAAHKPFILSASPTWRNFSMTSNYHWTETVTHNVYRQGACLPPCRYTLCVQRVQSCWSNNTVARLLEIHCPYSEALSLVNRSWPCTAVTAPRRTNVRHDWLTVVVHTLYRNIKLLLEKQNKTTTKITHTHTQTTTHTKTTTTHTRLNFILFLK